MVKISEVDSPQSTTWPCSTVYHCSAVVADKMYILAGLRSNKHHENTVFILDLNTYCWKEVEPKGKPPSPRCLASAVVVHHKIYMFGGYQIAKQGTHKCFNGMYVYDTTTETWDHLQTTGQSPDPRAGASMVLHQGKLYVYGGSQGRHVFFGDLFEFDVATQKWRKIETTGAFPKRRCCHTASMIGDLMYVFGGITADFQNQNQQVTNDLLYFNFDTAEWHEYKHEKLSPSPRCCHAAISMLDDLMVACGGDLLQSQAAESEFDLEELPDYFSDIYIFNTETKSWRRVKEGFGSHGLQPVLGLSLEYDAVHHRLLFFGGKLKNGIALSALFKLEFESKAKKGILRSIFSSSSMDEQMEKKFIQQDVNLYLKEVQMDGSAMLSPRSVKEKPEEMWESVPKSPRSPKPETQSPVVEGTLLDFGPDSSSTVQQNAKMNTAIFNGVSFGAQPRRRSINQENAPVLKKAYD